MVKLDSLERRLDSQIIKYFKSEGYSDDEIEESNLYTIEYKQNTHKKYVDIYIYAEISIDDFFTLSESWNAIVTSVDPSSYFDIVSPGIYMARIYWDSAKANSSEESKNILNQSNLTKFGEAITALLEDEFDEEFYVDEISFSNRTQKLSLEVSSDNYKSKCSIRIYEYDLDSYSDLVDMYQRKALKSLKTHIIEL